MEVPLFLLSALATGLAALALASASTPIVGISGHDYLHGTHSDDVILGRQGDDHIRGWTGSDRIDGGYGNDVLREWQGVGMGAEIDQSRDVFRGGPGNDTLYVGHNDHVDAGVGDDTVWAYYIGSGDLIDCGAGDDVLHLHQDINGLRTRGCETILITIAG
jgi:Ca2+-binding RTX toxin-like protein